MSMQGNRKYMGKIKWQTERQSICQIPQGICTARGGGTWRLERYLQHDSRTAKGNQSRRRKEPLFLLQQRHAVQLRGIPYCLAQSHLRQISDVLQGKELLRKGGFAGDRAAGGTDCRTQKPYLWPI